MNLLSKLFGKNGKQENSNQVTAENENIIPDEGFKQIFIDENPPANEFELVKENVLKLFMDQNFYSKGYNDGYEFHSRLSLESGIAIIISEYQHLLDIMIDEKKTEIHFLDMEKLQNIGMPGNISEMLDLRIEKLNEVVIKCTEEYEKSPASKGHIEFPLNKYSDGFEKGQMQYFKEKFFGQSTGMFN